MTTYTFTSYSAGTDLGATTGFTRVTGNSGSVAVNASKNLDFVTATPISLYTCTESTPDHGFEWTSAISSGGGNFYPCCVRVTDINNLIATRVTAVNNLELVKYVAGTPTTLGSYALTGRAIGDRIKTTAVGNTITVYYNDVQRIQVTESFNNSATLMGVFARSQNAINVVSQYKTYFLGAAVSSVNGGTNSVQIGSSGNTAETLGLTTATSASIGGVAMTSVAGSSSPWTFTCPPLTDEAVSPYPSGTFSITGAEGAPTLAGVAVTLPTGLTSVTLAGTLNTTNTGILYNFSPAAVVTDQIFYPPVPTVGKYITIDAQGNIDTDYDGTTQFWHWQASTGITRSYDVIVGAGGSSSNITSAGLTSIGLTRVGLTSSGL